MVPPEREPVTAAGRPVPGPRASHGPAVPAAAGTVDSCLLFLTRQRLGSDQLSGRDEGVEAGLPGPVPEPALPLPVTLLIPTQLSAPGLGACGITGLRGDSGPPACPPTARQLLLCAGSAWPWRASIRSPPGAAINFVISV